jgi:hypothetical protein
MASDHYTPVKPALNQQGQTADADDVNSVSNAVETAFETLEAEVDGISAQGSQWADLAQEWAENPEDQNITGEPAGSYSAKHYSIKAQASDTAAAVSAAAALSSQNAASASASSAAASAAAAAVNATKQVGGVLVSRTLYCTTGKFIDIVIPVSMDGFTLSTVIMTCTTAGISGTMVGNIEKNGIDMLSTGVSIDSGEVSSLTAAEVVATGDIITMEITGIHSGTVAKGCSIVLEFI